MKSPSTFRASLLKTARLFNDEVNKILLPFQLNSSLWQTLYVIKINQGCTALAIANYLNVSKPSITKRLHALLDLELLQQFATSDKRQKKFLLSEKGQALFAQCSSHIHAYEQNLIADLPPEQIDITREVLNRLIDKLLNAQEDCHDQP